MSAALLIGLHIGAGIGIGTCYFRLLWWSVRGIADGAPGRAGANLARFAVLAVLLSLASHEGAPLLLATAAGVLASRFLVLRQVRGVAA